MNSMRLVPCCLFTLMISYVACLPSSATSQQPTRPMRDYPHLNQPRPLNINLVNAGIESVVGSVNGNSATKIYLCGKAFRKPVTVQLENTTAEAVAAAIAEQHDFVTWRESDEYILIADREYYNDLQGKNGKSLYAELLEKFPNTGERLSLGAYDSRMGSVIDLYNSKAETKIKLSEDLENVRTTIILQNDRLAILVATLVQQHDLVYAVLEDGAISLMSKEAYSKQVGGTVVVERVFQPSHVKASEVHAAIKGLLTPELGSSVADDRTNKLIVNDLPERLDRVERFIREIDVAPPEA